MIALLAVVGILFCANGVSRSLFGTEEPPSLRFDSEQIEISVTEQEARLLEGVYASDPQDGDLTGKIYIQGLSKLITDNTAKVSYIVFDSHGNFDTATRIVRYTDYAKPRFSVDQPLIYGENEDIKLLDRIRALDVLDGDLTDSIRVSSLQATSDPDVWTVAVQATNSMGDTASLALPIIIHTGLVVRPQVVLTDYLVYMDQGESFRAQAYLDAVSTPIGPGETEDVVITGQVDTSQPGTYYVYYRYPYGVTTGLSVLTVVVR